MLFEPAQERSRMCSRNALGRWTPEGLGRFHRASLRGRRGAGTIGR
jgi:hypothetical protein